VLSFCSGAWFHYDMLIGSHFEHSSLSDLLNQDLILSGVADVVSRLGV